MLTFLFQIFSSHFGDVITDLYSMTMMAIMMKTVTMALIVNYPIACGAFTSQLPHPPFSSLIRSKCNDSTRSTLFTRNHHKPNYNTCVDDDYDDSDNDNDKKQLLSNRRSILTTLTLLPATISLATISPPDPSHALDVDSFVQQELERGEAPSRAPLSDAEAMCRYGASSPERGEACARAGMSTVGVRGGKGGADRFGQVDRGDFVRCVTSYRLVDGKYVKEVDCR